MTDTLRFWLALCALTLPVVAPAAPAAGSNDIEHRIVPGDTLEALSVQYLGTPRLWPLLQRHNRVPEPRRLQPGALLRIPAHLLPLGTAEVAFARGDVRVLAPGEAQAAPARSGQPLAEGASLQAAADSFVTVRLADGTLVRVQADSEVQIEQLRRRGRAGDAQSVLQLQRGSVEPSVPPAAGARRFEVRTPSASTAVRGTRFVVTLAADGRTLAAVTEGTLAVAPGAAAAAHPPALVAAGQGVAVAGDGRVAAPRALLAAPDLAALPDTLTDADFLTLRLAPVAGAAAYQVQVARDEAFSAVVRSATATSPEVRLPALDDGAWHVAARALDAEGLPGLRAQRAVVIKAHPVPPLYQTRADRPLARGQAQLQCTGVQGAWSYRVQVASTADFTNPLLDETREDDCGLSAAALASGSYHWRAASIRRLPDGSADQGPFGPARPVLIADAPPAVAASAIDARDSGEHLRLSWPGAPGQRFQLQAAADAGFATPLVDEELATPEWTAPALPPGAYFVRLRTLDPSGLQSAYSTPRRITLAAPVQDGSGQPVTASDGRPLAAP